MSRRKHAIEHLIRDDRVLRLFAPWAWQTINLFQNSGERQHRAKQSERVFDLLYLLMGSSLSTIVFARYCSRAGAHLITCEDNPDWLGLVERAAKAVGISGFRPVLVDRFDNADECGYDASVHLQSDFLYVDGPSHPGKRVCANAPRALKAGCRPRLIVLDGRESTVRALMQSSLGDHYDWYVAEKSAHEFEGGTQTRIGRHTIAIRRKVAR